MPGARLDTCCNVPVKDRELDAGSPLLARTKTRGPESGVRAGQVARCSTLLQFLGQSGARASEGREGGREASLRCVGALGRWPPSRGGGAAAAEQQRRSSSGGAVQQQQLQPRRPVRVGRTAATPCGRRVHGPAAATAGPATTPSAVTDTAVSLSVHMDPADDRSARSCPSVKAPCLQFPTRLSLGVLPSAPTSLLPCNA